jgi:hypothetical protein
MKGRLIAWFIALAVGLGWALLLRSAPADYSTIVALVLGLTGYFGVLLGIGIATGVIVGMLKFLGRPGATREATAALPADRTFGLCVILFALPSLATALGWWALRATT